VSAPDAYQAVGEVGGALAAFATFVGVYAAAVASVGWVIGLALGWIAAGIAGAIAYALVKYLWPFALLFGGLWYMSSVG
jgi:hypothetical protein